MIVIHALWREGATLALWAEDSHVEPPRRAGRPPRSAPHPFAAAPEALAATLGDLAAKAVTGSVTLSLPGRAGRPLDSPELLRDELPEQTRGPVTLSAWQIPTLEYGQDDALAVLRRLDGDGLTVGATLRHLATVADLARDLVSRGRILPAVVTAADRPRAEWRPVLTGADALWAQALALALPPAGRAGGGSAASVVAGALDALVDAAARAAWEAAAPPHVAEAGRRRRPGGTPVWDAWLGALRGRQRTFSGEPAAVAELEAALVDWQRDAVAGRVRALFRLVEPEDDIFAASEDRWRLEFALQAAEEPSLVVEAERVWQSRGALAALARHLDSPQETLLAELGRASRLYPALENALRTARPSIVELDGVGAHHFLREGAPLLAGAGFGVLLPSWWSRPRARLGARLSATSRVAPGTVAKKSVLGLNSIVDYEWQLALGDDVLTEAELRSLTELKTPLVRLRGRWVELDPKRLAAGLKMLTDGGQMTVADLLHAGLATEDGPGGLPVVSVAADGALGDLLSGQAERRLQPLATPDRFTGTLRPYQERGLAWLAFLESLGLGPILADDMGLGKTATVLALLLGDRGDAGPTLLVCPMSLVGNWQREVEKFAPTLRVHVHHGGERARGTKFTTAVANSDLVITTYSLAARDSAALSEIEWHRLVVDEAQAIKNAATRQAVAVRALPARHRIAVTGTPVENRLADLWSIMEFANPGLLGSALSFKKRYAEPVERRGDEVAAERLKRLTGPFVLRRVKTDKSIISDLPEKLEMEVLCNLTAEQASLYQAVVDDMMRRIEASDGIERRGLVLATMTKLKQVCNHPAQLLRDGTRLAGRSGKLARLEEILEEVLDTGEKALLFTQYAEFGGMLRAHLAAHFGREVAFLHGGVPKAERDAMVSRFQGVSLGTGRLSQGVRLGTGRLSQGVSVGTGRLSQGAEPSSPALFILSLKAGGTGLTLTAANHVIHVDRWWNPAVEDQATDRAFRIGQKRNVQVRKFVCAGTVEEKISAMISDKRGLAAKIVGSGEQWLTELSTSELRNLFALEKGAVVE